MRRLMIFLTAGALGVALTLAGLVVDAWLHAQDSTLAAREGVFTLGNPGHAVLAAGLALVCGGVLGALHAASSMIDGPGVLGRAAVRHAALAASALASAGAIFFALTVSVAGHDHAHAGAVSAGHQQDAPADSAPLPASTVSVAAHADDAVHAHEDAAQPAPPANESMVAGAADAHAHEESPPLATTAPDAHAHDAMPAGAGQPAVQRKRRHDAGWPAGATPEQIACGQDLAARTREAIERFEDFSVALTEGYRSNPAKPNATHYGSRRYIRDGKVMDLARPETLVYFTKPDGTKALAGAMYSVARGQQGPQPCGPVTTWHTHEHCLLPDGGEGAHPEDGVCPEGQAFHESGEMIHVWTLGGVTNPFAQNPGRAAIIGLLTQ